MADLLYNALFRTLMDHRTLAVYKLQKIAAMEGRDTSLIKNSDARKAMRFSTRKASMIKKSILIPGTIEYEESFSS